MAGRPARVSRFALGWRFPEVGVVRIGLTAVAFVAEGLGGCSCRWSRPGARDDVINFYPTLGAGGTAQCAPAVSGCKHPVTQVSAYRIGIETITVFRRDVDHGQDAALMIARINSFGGNRFDEAPPATPHKRPPLARGLTEPHDRVGKATCQHGYGHLDVRLGYSVNHRHDSESFPRPARTRAMRSAARSISSAGQSGSSSGGASRVGPDQSHHHHRLQGPGLREERDRPDRPLHAAAGACPGERSHRRKPGGRGRRHEAGAIGAGRERPLRRRDRGGADVRPRVRAEIIWAGRSDHRAATSTAAANAWFRSPGYDLLGTVSPNRFTAPACWLRPRTRPNPCAGLARRRPLGHDLLEPRSRLHDGRRPAPGHERRRRPFQQPPGWPRWRPLRQGNGGFKVRHPLGL